MVKFRVRLMEEKDFKAVRKIREANTLEYLEFLRRTDSRLYSAEVRESRAPAVDANLFNFYLESGSSFVAEVNSKVVGFVFSQTIEFMHSERRMMWIEYVGVQTEYRRQGIGYSLLSKVMEYAKQHSIQRVESTINPDNEASIRLHEKAGFKVKDWKRAIYNVK